MNDVCNYIFSNMKRIEKREDYLLRAAESCSKANKRVGIYMFASAAFMVFANHCLIEQRDRISVLDRKIEILEKKLENNKEV